MHVGDVGRSQHRNPFQVGPCLNLPARFSSLRGSALWLHSRRTRAPGEKKKVCLQRFVFGVQEPGGREDPYEVVTLAQARERRQGPALKVRVDLRVLGVLGPGEVSGRASERRGGPWGSSRPEDPGGPGPEGGRAQGRTGTHFRRRPSPRRAASGPVLASGATGALSSSASSGTTPRRRRRGRSLRSERRGRARSPEVCTLKNPFSSRRRVLVVRAGALRAGRAG